MRQAKPTSGSSGWEWNSQGPTPQPPQRRPQPPARGSGEALLAGVVFVIVAAIAVAAYLFLNSDDGEPSETATAEDTDAPSVEAPPAPAPADAKAKPVVAVTPPRARRPVPAFDTISWTVETPSTLQDLVGAWSIPKDILLKLNPKLPTRKPIEAGVSVVVYAKTLGRSSSIGPPNDGRLVWGVPLPENEAWLHGEDRSRAFATTETIASVVSALYAYADQFPDAAPIQVGDLSARRGGKIFGHQSHQSGMDIDIRLVRNSAGDGFDAGRTWFLVKTLIDENDVRAIFLNRTEQVWLRAAADADVGAASAERYFALIRHEPGHTIHMHVRFACSDEDKRCVGYSLPDSGETAPPETVNKLPGKLPSAPSAKPAGGDSKRPRLLPKSPTKPKAKATKKGKKKGKKKK